MSSIGSPSPFLLGGKKSYSIGRSLRFNGADGPYLESQPSSHSDKKKNTFSFWFKRAVNTNFVSIFRAFGTSSNRQSLDFLSGGAIRLWGNYNGSVVMTLQTSRLFRDFSAWYHFVLVLDTEQGTASNRAKMYVNGVQITDFSNSSYPPEDFEFGFNDQNVKTQIGVPSDTQCNYYIAEFQAIDGLALDPSYFAETDSITGQWNPKKYDGSYGTNGFYLNFADNSGTTATTLGKDISGVGRNFTPYNFSVSAGAGNDSLEDTPTNNYPTLNPLDMGSTNSSHLVFSNGNLQVKAASGVWAATRATFAVSSGKWYWEVKILSAATLRPFIGIIESKVRLASNQTEQSNELGPTSTGIAYWVGSPLVRGGTNTSGTSTNVPTCTTGDIVGVALDMDNKKVFFSKNGTFFASQDPANSSGELISFSTTMQTATIAPAIQTYNGTSEVAMNFGQRAFDYTPPTGYKALSSKNLPDPTIKKPNQYFDTAIYTGDGSSGKQITGLNFKPDLVWVKCRSNNKWNILVDAVRGNSNNVSSNSTSAEYAETHVTSFNSDGFTVADIDSGTANENGFTYVGWSWDAGETDSKTYTVTVVNDGGNKYRFDGYGTSAVTLSLAKGGTYTFNYPSAHPLRFSTTSDGTHGGGSEYTSGVTTYGNSITITVAANAPTLYYYCSQHSGMGGQLNPTTTLGSSNFDGTIQSVAKVNPSAGFSIVTYSGNHTSGATVGHGLGVAPKVVIVKARGTVNNQNRGWNVYHTEIGNTKYIQLQSSSASITNSDWWNNTSPNSTTFTLGNDYDVNANISGGNYLAYCFSEVTGYSKFGSYTGNGSSDGTFVFTGFRPAWIMIKKSSGNSRWSINDIKRNPENVTDALLFAEDSIPESASSSHNIDLLSNGFKHHNTEGELNGSGEEFIYLAFAEAPFKYARAR